MICPHSSVLRSDFSSPAVSGCARSDVWSLSSLINSINCPTSPSAYSQNMEMLNSPRGTEKKLQFSFFWKESSPSFWKESSIPFFFNRTFHSLSPGKGRQGPDYSYKNILNSASFPAKAGWLCQDSPDFPGGTGNFPQASSSCKFPRLKSSSNGKIPAFWKSIKIGTEFIYIVTTPALQSLTLIAYLHLKLIIKLFKIYTLFIIWNLLFYIFRIDLSCWIKARESGKHIVQGSNSSLSKEKQEWTGFFPNEKLMLPIPEKNCLDRSCETILIILQYSIYMYNII